MIAVDTNVVVRFLTGDDVAQFKKAVRLFNESEVFIPDSVLLETEWVLRYAYHFSPNDIVIAFRKILGLSSVHVENTDKIAKIIILHEQGVDFADAMHLANSASCSALATFDKRFVKRAKGKSECAVRAL